MTAPADRNLTGDWQGLYSYPGNQPPTPFLARLTETDGWIAGAIEEIATVGDTAGQPITATLAGRRIGRSVTFLKTYDATLIGYDAVAYAGEIDASGDEIDGRWRVSASWTGPFLMIRSGAAGVYAARVVRACV